MTVLVQTSPTTIVIREPGPAGAQGAPGAPNASGTSTRFQGQSWRMTDATVSGITQNVYSIVNISGFFDNSVASGIVAASGTGFGLRNNTGATFVFQVSVALEVSAGSQDHLGITLTKNGAVVSGTDSRAHTGNLSSEAPLNIPRHLISLNNGDEVGVAVANFSASANIIIRRGRTVASV